MSSVATENRPETSRDVVASVRNVTKVYRLGGEDVKALAGVSIDFHQGDFVAIMDLMTFDDEGHVVYFAEQ